MRNICSPRYPTVTETTLKCSESTVDNVTKGIKQIKNILESIRLKNSITANTNLHTLSNYARINPYKKYL